MVAFKELELEKVHTDDNRVDMMTKSLPRGKMQRDRRNVGFLQLVGGGVFLPPPRWRKPNELGW